jgi:hypothetical protein
MSALNQIDYYEPTVQQIFSNPYEAFLMECSRLIHAAVISKRFLSSLLANPLNSIEDGFCGEKFSFSREEKQLITNIHASNLAEFSQLLLQAVQQPCCLPAPADLVFAHSENYPEISS